MTGFAAAAGRVGPRVSGGRHALRAGKDRTGGLRSNNVTPNGNSGRLDSARSGATARARVRADFQCMRFMLCGQA